MSFTYILSKSDFTDRFDLAQNFLDRRFNQVNRIVQQKFGSKVICKETYDEIIDQLAQGDGEETYLDAKYVTLLPYIKDYLSAKVYERYIIDSNTIATAGGIITPSDDISTRLTQNELESMARRAERDAQFYEDELRNFLEDNTSTYTLWRDSVCNCGHTDYKGSLQPGLGPKTKNVIKWT